MAEKESQRGRPRFGSEPKPHHIPFGTSMPPDLLERLDRYCKEDERSRSWAIQKAVDTWLKGKGY
jgi:hypothetical protein